jgi:DMSO reductase family type II enzyme molybdopterin subunit
VERLEQTRSGRSSSSSDLIADCSRVGGHWLQTRETRRACEEKYREQWRWDKVFWGSHCVDCYPGDCPYRVYVEEGRVVFEEPAAAFENIEPGVPDMNPMGCQKGACWSLTLDGEDRILFPMRRTGERGEGKWERISWVEAISELADAITDAGEDVGPESVVMLSGAEGGTWTTLGIGRLIGLIGGLTTDVNAEVGDFSPGLYLTFGKFNLASSLDDTFHAELLLMIGINPAYTVTASYHFAAEARYKGAELFLFAPDCNPSHSHVDYFVPVKPGTDAAWALSVCQVIISEGLFDSKFVKEQTDLPFLVRLDNHRFLREQDLEKDGRDDRFYFCDSGSGAIVQAPRNTLSFEGVDPALTGVRRVLLNDGSEVEVAPVFQLLSERLQSFTPEVAHHLSNVHPDTIRRLARSVSQRRTMVWAGGTTLKYYHGDLMVRSLTLLLALTGNWGKKGTGIGCWSTGLFDGPEIFRYKKKPGPDETKAILAAHKHALDVLKARDPSLTDEIAMIELARRAAKLRGIRTIPPAFFWYYHCGYREQWNNPEWGDTSMRRKFDEYFSEALQKGWWEGNIKTDPQKPPRVLLQCGGNTLRRVRGGQNMLLKHLWPKLKKIVTLDWRMSTTAIYSDIILPITNQYETPRFHMTHSHMLLLLYSEAAALPAGEAKSEWEVALLLAKALEERTSGGREMTSGHTPGRKLFDVLTLGGTILTEEQAAEEMVRDTSIVGNIPADSSLERLRNTGFLRFTDWGVSVLDQAQASDISETETFSHSRRNIEKKLPYPTLTRRAQFYIEHPWFLEAGEELPTFKANPRMGGDYPFEMTSGHGRWSIHSMNVTTQVLLQTHRGRPHLCMNPSDANRLGIVDNSDVRVSNDIGSFVVPVKLAPGVRPGQVVIYNGWEPYMFEGWSGPMDIEPGLVKWLHFAGGYGHLHYWPIQWQPTPTDRGIRVDVAPSSRL